MSKGAGGQKSRMKKDQPAPRRRADGDTDERSGRVTDGDEQDMERAVDADERDDRDEDDEEQARREDERA
jgi:hypothetical protein